MGSSSSTAFLLCIVLGVASAHYQLNYEFSSSNITTVIVGHIEGHPDFTRTMYRGAVTVSEQVSTVAVSIPASEPYEKKEQSIMCNDPTVQ